jgi:hypothetical protein
MSENEAVYNQLSLLLPFASEGVTSSPKAGGLLQSCRVGIAPPYLGVGSLKKLFLRVFLIYSGNPKQSKFPR